MQLYTVKQIAEITGRSEIGVRKIAERQNARGVPVGQKVGGVWIFTAAEVERLRSMVNKAGRPAKAKPPLPAQPA